MSSKSLNYFARLCKRRSHGASFNDVCRDCAAKAASVRAARLLRQMTDRVIDWLPADRPTSRLISPHRVICKLFLSRSAVHSDPNYMSASCTVVSLVYRTLQAGVDWCEEQGGGCYVVILGHIDQRRPAL